MSTTINPKTFCLAPWAHACINVQTKLKPCCVFQDDNNITYENYNTWWHSNEMAILRKDLLNGNQHSGCSACWKSESLGRESLRQGYNNIFKSYINFEQLRENIKNNNFHEVPDAVTWELDIGNLCNLKCIMCDPIRSNKIQEEVLEFSNNFTDFPILVNQANSYIQQNWIESTSGQEFLFKIKPNLKWIKLQGGEALTIKGVRNLIENLDTSQVTLSFTTNGTILDQRLLDIFKEFKKVEISVSVEAAGEENDTIRYGSSWDTIKKNILLLNNLDNIDLQLNHVLQVTSLLFLPGVLKFAEENNLHLAILPLTMPNYLHISAGPPDITDKFLKSLKDIIITHPKNIQITNYVTEFVLKNKFNLDRFNLFVNYINALDNIRNKKLSDICKPILESVL
jgi:MoaA/NifB/PqqE/SkfB family radical SAM enzyme